MADETLRLTVDLVDNATPQLARIRGEMQNLGSSETSNALRTSTQRVKEMREQPLRLLLLAPSIPLWWNAVS